MWSQKTNLKKFKRIKIIQSILSNNNEIIPRNTSLQEILQILQSYEHTSNNPWVEEEFSTETETIKL